MRGSLGRSIVARVARLFPGGTLRALQALGLVDRAEMRTVRATILRVAAERLSRVIVATHYPHAITVAPDGEIFVDHHGVLLSTGLSNAYFKALASTPSHAAEMVDFLRAHDIELKTVIDVGANFGEITLHLARYYPGARILAIEPSPENLAVLRRNIAAQPFDTSGVEALPIAVSDRTGTARLSHGWASENSLIANPDNTPLEVAQVAHVEVATERLGALMDARGVERADLVKVDIEGPEPLLAADLVQLRDRIRSLHIEFSSKNSAEQYLALLDALLGAGYRCFQPAEPRRPIPRENAVAAYEASRRGTGEGSNGIDLWFVRPFE